MGCLSACAVSGEWPNLSDKIPDASERIRVVEIAAASAVPEPAPTPVVSATDARVRLAEITTSIDAAKGAYNEALASYTASTNDSALNGTHLWLDAQLALTRFSQTVSTLDQIIYNDSVKGTAPASAAAETKKTFDQIVVAERQNLERIKPEAFNKP